MNRTESPSAAVYDVLAEDYEAHFAVPHRRAYDDLAWEFVESLLPSQPTLVLDAGCGVGRWTQRLVDRRHQVVGLEPSPAMAAAARRRSVELGPDRFRVVEAMMEDCSEIPTATVGVVLAMGSLQYAGDIDAALDEFHRCLVPGGRVALLVDSLGGLIGELLRSGRTVEAIERAGSRQGRWCPQPGLCADLHLFDKEELARRMGNAGFVDVRSHGLLVSATIRGVPALNDSLRADPRATMDAERALAHQQGLADLGKQLLVLARKPA